ncbi:MAG: alpha/beta fold hydrolase [Desulfuromonadales bacterium]|nr:alpha/beta fold hydrolase [Desulfuromonadales bacterium]
MNRHAYLATGHVIALMEALSKVNVNIHGRENIPDGSLIFVVNHFTRIETFLLPYHIYYLTNQPVWSLADHDMFSGAFGQLLEAGGAVSSRTPRRDRLIVKSLLTGEANWIIYPEGCMVKDKVFVEHARYAVSYAGGRRPPHTGAATLALRTEFYRQRLRHLSSEQPAEAERLRKEFGIADLAPVLSGKTSIVPVNITYYPLRAKENALSRLAEIFLGPLSERHREELLTEGAMVLQGVDIDIRFGLPLESSRCLSRGPIEQDIMSLKQIDFDDRLPSRQTMRHEAFRLMKRYMDAIYEHTTVNHDHLFASLLRGLPFRRFSLDDFRRRAFLLASSVALSGLYRHQSLESGQVALLTDDRHHKIREFFTLALETGVVRYDGVDFIKDQAKFSSSFDLDRARIDNPIGVIANEVLPLKALQREVLLVAWMPSPIIGTLVYKRLLRRADEEFEADYRTFFRTGESKERDTGRPYLVKGKSRKMGVVLVHGFLAAPREVSELAGYLGKQGLWVAVVRLKGHGTSPDDLALRTGEDWRESVDSAFAAMSIVCKQVILVGFSFGGGLALDCAARNKDVAGVVAVCPPLRLQDFSSRYAPSLEKWNRLMAAVHFQKGKREFLEITLEHPDINYHRLPVTGLVALEQFMDELETKLPGITTPALIIQSQGDPVVAPEGSKMLFVRLGSPHKEYRLFDFKRHGILSGEGADKVHTAIGEFIEKIRGI